MRVTKIRRWAIGRRLALTVAVSVAMASPSHGQVYPSPPQSTTSSDGIDAPGFVRVPAVGQGGVGGFVDVPAYGACRFVTVTRPGVGGEAIALQSKANWLNWRTHTPAGDTQEVCCRPQAVTLCQGAAGGTVPMTLPYSILGEALQPVAQCIDQWGKPYEDTQTWVCGEAGSGVMADGNWQQQGGDAYTCSPNAFTSGCSATCPTTAGTTTTYDSCGNVQAVNGCTISCCTSNWVKSCNGDLATYSDVGSCHDPSYQIPGGCSPVTSSCSASCTLGTHTTTIFSSSGSDYCETDYEDCGYWTGSTAGGTDCITEYGQESYSQTCTESPGGGGTIQVPVKATCNCTVYE